MNGSAPHFSLRKIRISCLSAHIGLPTYCYFSIIPADRKEKHYTLHSWLASYGAVCVCMCTHACVCKRRCSSSEPWKLLHLGHGMASVSYIRPPFPLCNCVYLVFQQMLWYRGESRREAQEDTQASEVEQMKYFVGTALGKKTSTVLGNALGTAWGGAAFSFFYIHVENAMLVLLLCIMFSLSLWKEFSNFTPVSICGQIPHLYLILYCLCWVLLKLLYVYTDSLCSLWIPTPLHNTWIIWW